MWKRKTHVVALILTCLASGVLRAEQQPVTLESLLAEMTNREDLARLPEPSWKCLEASSHDRQKSDPANPQTWHSNKDFEQFIRTENNEGRQEWVIMEHEGPGAIVRMWLPLNGEKDNQIIRFYFDGAATAAIAVKFNDLMSGRSFVKPPLAFVAWNESDLRKQKDSAPPSPRGVGGDLYLPICFAKQCKVTLDQLPFYYIINYRAYAPGTSVRTFSRADFQAAKPALERTSDALLANGAAPPNDLARKANLAPGKELSIDLPNGPAAVRNLRVHLENLDEAQSVRSIVLQASFDDTPCVWCPLSEFFGAGVRGRPVQDWFRTVEKDGTLTSRWVMPYQRAGRVSLKNLGTKPVGVSLAAATGPWNWDDRSMHFHATWHSEMGIKTRPMFDWNYVQVTGAGRYVGDTLTVYSSVPEWYGEGDERIYVDGQTFPSHIGTGTEDYYGYAWGMAGFFSSPFISMPQRDATGQNWVGYTTTSRVRLLDNIPFQSSLKHDMEIWNWADTRVDYSVGTFWYGRPGSTSNRVAQPAEASLAVRPAPPDPHLKRPGAIECETLQVAGHSPDLPVEAQDVSGIPTGHWSGGQQLFARATKVGDFVELKIPVADAHPQKMSLFATKSYDYGILRISVNGKPAVKEFDGYNPDSIDSGPIDLGTFEPVDGNLVLRAEVVGTNPSSRKPGFYFGLDCVVLTPARLGAEDPIAKPTTQPIHQADDGTVLLHARDVMIHGTTVRYEPQPQKNTIGYWTRKEDWVSWDFKVDKAAKFEVLILQGCGTGSGGSEVEFTVGEQSMKTTVQDTGGFQNFVSRNIGTLDLKPGNYTLTVKPITKPGLAVMDLRSVTLKPAEPK